MAVSRDDARKELKRRAQAARLELGRRAEIRARILADLHDKQREVIEAVEAGERFIGLCCSRRAGKTYLLASLIILKLLDAGHNQSVIFVAPDLKWGKFLIWKELARLIELHGLPWKTKEHVGIVETPAGASFRILGLNREDQTNATRGGDTVLVVTDESQHFEHLLGDFITATAPALAGRKGCFLAAGTPGIALRGPWFDITHGKRGFKGLGWDVRQNPKLPRPPEEVLKEEREREGYTETHPTYQREWLGLWVPDFNLLVCEYGDKNQLDLLPGSSLEQLIPGYGLHWKHIISMDVGQGHATAWSVLALDPRSSTKYVVHAEKETDLNNDQICVRTKTLIERFGTKFIVADPGGGGSLFRETFNARYARDLGTSIRAATKGAGSVVASTNFLNTELRTGRLKLVLPNAQPLENELQTLRWKDEFKEAILESKEFPDDLFDSLRYGLMVFMPKRPQDQVLELTPEQQRQKNEEDLLARFRGNRDASEGGFGGGRF